MNYPVSLEKNGAQVPVGQITGDNSGTARFSYAKEYWEAADAAAISASLPLQRDAFSAEQTRCFFEGLLPEGFMRRSLAQRMRLDETDYLAMLHALGNECLGALRISADGGVPEAKYEKLSPEHVRALAAEGTLRSTELIKESHLSLTGASGKVGLYLDEGSRNWYLPKGTAPSTHIIKQSHIRLDGIVTNEQLCMRTAARCGIAVPESFIVNTGSGREDEVLFATRRYDRIFPKSGDTIDGLPCPLRLHQEDMAQALGIPAAKKYENGKGQYLRYLFALIRSISADPVADQIMLWDRVVFNYLIGNTDAHIKNFSLLYGADLRTVRLAPAYDLLSTAVYESSTRELAFRLGDAYTLEEVTEDSFRAAAKEVGLGEKMALRRLEEMRERFPAALYGATEELTSSGFEKAEELAARICKDAAARGSIGSA